MRRLLLSILTSVLCVGISHAADGLIKTDVLVVGGGTSGTVAAIQAARSGAKVVILEASTQLGGTMTVGGVSFPGLFYAWEKRIISGVGWELVCEAVELDGGRMPDFTVPCGANHPAHQILLNAPLYAALCEEKCLKEGVTLRYGEFPIEVSPKGRGWKVQAVGRGTEVSIECKVLIDATGDASAAALAGCERIREEATQPGSLIFTLTGYDYDSLDFDVLQAAMDKAKADGVLQHTDCYASVKSLLRAQPGLAMSHVVGADRSNSVSATAADIAGRESLLRLLRFLRTLPGLEKLRISSMQAQTAVRETYRIVGRSCVTGKDYVDGVVYPDAVCYSYYPIDLHTAEGVEPRHLERGVVATVPFGAMLPANAENILVIGRAICSDRLANSALRVQATCMAGAQAAGTAAAIAVRNNCLVGKVDISALRAELSSSGAIVPEIK